MPFLLNIGRNNSEFRLARRHNAGAIRSDKPSFFAFHVAANSNHIQNGNVFRNADDKIKLRVNRLKNRIRRKRSRHINYRSRRARRLNRIFNRIENGNAFNILSRLAGRHAADYFCPVSHHLFRVKSRRLARYSLHNNFRVPVNQNHFVHSPENFPSKIFFSIQIFNIKIKHNNSCPNR